MSRFVVSLSLIALAGFALGLNGCKTSDDSPPAESPESRAPAATTPAQHSEGEDAGHEAEGEYAEALAKLSEADRALAAKQKVCPVSGQALGSMGTPVKVTVKGRDVLLCCQGCEDSIKNDPDKYLAKLPE